MTEEQLVALFDQLTTEMVDRATKMVRTGVEQAARKAGAPDGADLFEPGDEQMMAGSIRAGVVTAIAVLVERGIVKLDDL